jgi:hypothetical protein
MSFQDSFNFHQPKEPTMAEHPPSFSLTRLYRKKAASGASAKGRTEPRSGGGGGFDTEIPFGPA